MTATLERPVNTQQSLVLSAVAECIRCGYIGRIEWLPDGTIQTLHKGFYGNKLCILRLPPGAKLSLHSRAVLLLR